MTKAKIEAVKYAGVGADGDEFAVNTLAGGPGVNRRKPCPTCPWRKDAPIGAFPAEAYRHSASTAYDGALNTFGCHESGSEKPATCAGFLLANADHNIGVRLRMSHKGRPEVSSDAELYESYEAMAVANGVDPLDPVLDMCRGNHEDGRHKIARERMKKRAEIGWRREGEDPISEA